MSEKTPMIYAAMHAITADMDAITKTHTGPHGYKFRGIDDAMGALHPLLQKHGVSITTEVLECETSGADGWTRVRVTMAYHFTAVDGSRVTSSMLGEGIDKQDKATSKAVAMAFKYAIFQTFCIPTEEASRDDVEYHAPEMPVQEEREARKESLKSLKLPDGWQRGKLGSAFHGLKPDYSGWTWNEIVDGKGKTPSPAEVGGQRHTTLKQVWKDAVDAGDLILALKCETQGKLIAKRSAAEMDG